MVNSTSQGSPQNMELHEQIIVKLKAMPMYELQSLVDGYARDSNLQMIMTTYLAVHGDFPRQRVALRALSQFGKQGVGFILEEIYRAPDQVAVFLFGTLCYFDGALVREVVHNRLDQFTGFKRNQLGRFAKRWWQFWK